MKLDIPTQIVDVLGNALVVAAKYAPEAHTGTYVQAWAWLSDAARRAAEEEERVRRAEEEAAIKQRVAEELKAKE